MIHRTKRQRPSNATHGTRSIVRTGPAGSRPLGGGRQAPRQLQADLQRILHARAGRHLPAPRHQSLRRRQPADRGGPGRRAKCPSAPIRQADYIKRRALLLPEDGPLRRICSSCPKAPTSARPLVRGHERHRARLRAARRRAPQGLRQLRARTSSKTSCASSTAKPLTHRQRRRLRPHLRILPDEVRHAGRQDNGEFFTPPSLVQTIVNVIEPDHGIVFDPACGSGGMFVQSSHFIERRGQRHRPPRHLLRPGEEPPPPSASPR